MKEEVYFVAELESLWVNNTAKEDPLFVRVFFTTWDGIYYLYPGQPVLTMDDGVLSYTSYIS